MPKNTPQKKLIIVSDDIRRDSHVATKYFKKIKIFHFYRKARYSDMTKDDFENTVKYQDHSDLYNKLLKYKPDIIQGPEPYASKAAFLNSLTALKYCKKFKIPFLFPMFENVTATKKFGFLLGKIMQIYLKKYVNASCCVVALNKGAVKELTKIGIKKEKIVRMIWGTWGIDQKEFFPDSKQRSKIPTCLFVGKIEEQKGINTIINALKIVKTKVKNIQLIVVGFGSLVDKIKKQPNVKYIGLVKNKDIPKYFREAWVTVSPSIATKKWEEQVGMVNIQSIACGTPVISTYSGAIPEYLPDKKAGLLVKEDDHKDLADKIAHLLTNSRLRNKLSQDGLKYCKSRYLVEDNIKKAENLILEILKGDKI